MADYDITTIDTDTTSGINGHYSNVIMLTPTLGITCWWNPGVNAVVQSFILNGSNVITRVTTTEIDATEAKWMDMCKIDDTHFALACQMTTADDGYVQTWSVASNGTSLTKIDELEHDTTQGLKHAITLLDSTHFAIHYTGGTDDGIVKTFSFDGSFTNITQIDSLQVANGWGYSYPKGIMKFDATHWVSACQVNSGFNPGAKVFAFDGNFDNLANTTTSAAFNADSADDFDLHQIDATHFMMIETSANKCRVHSFSVNASTYAIAEISEVELIDRNIRGSTSFVDATHFLCGYVDVTDRYLQLVILTLDGSFNITEGTPTAQLTAAETDYTKLAKIDDEGNYIVAYMVGGENELKTVNVEGVSSGWSNTIAGVDAPAAVNGVVVANITSVNGV